MQESLFLTLDDLGTNASSDELEEYLNTPAISIKNLDPITWWYAIGMSSPLAQMGIDFLSAPGKWHKLLNDMLRYWLIMHGPASSCDVEHGFSRGGLTVTKLWHTLSDDSTQASTILHAWSEIPGLISEADIIEVFKDKGCHLKGVNKQGISKDTESIVLDSGSEDED
jgi:hypothetical protein